MFWKTPVAVMVAALCWGAIAAAEGINAGGRPDTTALPFRIETMARFDRPWALAFLPDGRLLITEKAGQILLVAQDGAARTVQGVPEVLANGQNGLLDIAVSPDFATSAAVYFTYVAPEGQLVLARAQLQVDPGQARLENLQLIWRQTPAGGGGQPGGIIAFDPAGTHLFLTVGDRMRPESAQDPAQARGKLLRLDLDGGTPPDNPMAAQGGVAAQIWTLGHRNPYGLAFAPDGGLWLHEMGPRGGDELNLIRAGQNYGWPNVSNGDQYDGTDIPDHASRPEFAAPPLYWTPVIAPAGLVFYDAPLFAGWQGSALIGGLRSRALVQVAFAPDGHPEEVARWPMEARIRDVAVAPDGAVWIIEDDSPGRLRRLTPAP